MFYFCILLWVVWIWYALIWICNYFSSMSRKASWSMGWLLQNFVFIHFCTFFAILIHCMLQLLLFTVLDVIFFSKLFDSFAFQTLKFVWSSCKVQWFFSRVKSTNEPIKCIFTSVKMFSYFNICFWVFKNSFYTVVLIMVPTYFSILSTFIEVLNLLNIIILLPFW